MLTLCRKKTASAQIAVIGVGDNKRLSDDTPGLWIRKHSKQYGHEVLIHQVVAGDIHSIRDMVSHVSEKIIPQALILCGGTGISPWDVTAEAVLPLLQKRLHAFETVFSSLAFERFDSAAVMYGAQAGIIGNMLVFCIPDSMEFCKLACRELIFPELAAMISRLSNPAMN